MGEWIQPRRSVSGCFPRLQLDFAWGSVVIRVHTPFIGCIVMNVLTIPSNSNSIIQKNRRRVLVSYPKGKTVKSAVSNDHVPLGPSIWIFLAGPTSLLSYVRLPRIKASSLAIYPLCHLLYPSRTRKLFLSGM